MGTTGRGRGVDTYALSVSGSSVYVAGAFYSTTASFGAATLTNANANGITNDVFVAKLTDAGSTAGFVWAQQAGGLGSESVNALVANGNNVYLAGGFSSLAASFGSIVLTNANTTPMLFGGFDLYVAKLADAGPSAGFAWATRSGGTGEEFATGLAVNGTNVYVAATFSGSAASFGSTVLSSAGSTDVAVVKLVDTGTSAGFGWAARAGGTGADEAQAVTVSGTNLYVVGSFNSAAATFGPTTLATAGDYDIFVAKLVDAGSGGAFAWAQRGGGPTADYGGAVAVNGVNVYVGGSFTGGAAGFGNTVLASAGNNDAVVAKLLDAGATAGFVWAKGAGGSQADCTNALTLNGAMVYVSGYVSPPASFGLQTITNTVSTVSGFLTALPNAVLASHPAVALVDILLFPNPAHGTATIQLPAIPGAITATLTLLDALGRTVRTQMAVTNARTALDLNGLAPGLYALRVAAGGHTATRRLVVE